MDIMKKQLQEDIEVAIRVRDNCRTLAEKDAIARLINFAEEVIKVLELR